MTVGTQTKIDTEQATTEKAKPVAVDNKSKHLAQSGRLTPEERIAAIKELVSEEEKWVKRAVEGGRLDAYTASYETKRGKISISAENIGKEDFILGKTLVTLTAPDRLSAKGGEITAEGNFDNLKHIIVRNLVITEKETLKTEWAEKFVDGLIKDALEAKRSAPK